MCGRFLLTTPARTLASLFEVEEVPARTPRYNIAPSQPVPIIRPAEGRAGRECVELRWGLLPSWSREPAGVGLINARSETVAEKPSFRTPFRKRRCLIPADGFYEWRPAGRRKQPYAVRLRDGGPCAFAGLWDRWHSADGTVLESAAILTTEANSLVRPIHERMPVIVRPEEWAAWLDPRRQDPAELLPLLRPYPAERMTAFPVGTWVSNPRNEGPRCLEPKDPLTESR